MSSNTRKRSSDEESSAQRVIPRMVQQIHQPECTDYGPNREADLNGFSSVPTVRISRTKKCETQ